MSKYNDLPDIDTSSVDVYEWAGELLEEPTIARSAYVKAHANDYTEEEIETRTLDVKRSASVFETSDVNIPDDIDLAYDELSLEQKGYNVRNGIETLDAKIARLRREVAQVIELVSKERNAEGRATHADGKEHEQRQQMEEMGRILDNLALERKAGKVYLYDGLRYKELTQQEQAQADRQEDGGKLAEHALQGKQQSFSKHLGNSRTQDNVPVNQANRPGINKTSATDRQILVRAAELEKRLASLEKKVGSNRDRASEESLVATIDSIQRKVSLFANGGEDAVEVCLRQIERLALACNKLVTDHPGVSARFKDGADFATSGANTATIMAANQLYHELHIIESYKSILPQIINRMKTLGHIHLGASDTVTRMNEMDATIATMKMELDNWRSSLNVLEEKIVHYDKTAEDNRKQLAEWMDGSSIANSISSPNDTNNT